MVADPDGLRCRQQRRQRLQRPRARRDRRPLHGDWKEACPRDAERAERGHRAERASEPRPPELLPRDGRRQQAGDQPAGRPPGGLRGRVRRPSREEEDASVQVKPVVIAGELDQSLKGNLHEHSDAADGRDGQEEEPRRDELADKHEGDAGTQERRWE